MTAKLLIRSITMNTKTLRQKILDLAIHGKLVAQDPDDEPASELLKRINPQAEQTYEEELPKGWTYCKLEDVVDYEQPTNYIVHSTNYSDAYSIPVLTAGKSFIIGYTNEHENVYTKLPCIIFDDFTTNSKFVDFQFKVKSSAMKILQVRAAAEVKYVAMFMSITRLIGDTHKRYWISEYSKKKIPLPPLAEQKRIVTEIERWFALIDQIEQSKAALQATIAQAKKKILDLAIHGKLVAQDPDDEPASELLKRINPQAEQMYEEELPKGWVITPMNILCSLVDGEKQSGIERINLDVKYLRGDRRAKKTLSSGKYVAANSLLILVDGENSGEVFRTPIEGYQGSTLKQLFVNANMNIEYVLQVINLHRKELRENKVGSAIPHLNKKLFKEIEVPLPPLAEQKRIVKKIEELFGVLDTIQQALGE